MVPTLKHTNMGFFTVLNSPDFGRLNPTHPYCACHHRYGEPLALRYARRPRQARDVLTPHTTGMIPISTPSARLGESAFADQSALARGTPLDPRSQGFKSWVPRLKPPTL